MFALVNMDPVCTIMKMSQKCIFMCNSGENQAYSVVDLELVMNNSNILEILFQNIIKYIK